MGRIVTYKDGEFCQIAFESGERVMLSQIGPHYVIRRMHLGGFIPGKVFIKWSVPEEIYEFLALAGANTGKSGSFRLLVESHLKFRSIDELKASLREAGSEDTIVDD